MKRKGYLAYGIIGWLFVFCWVTERELAEKGNIVWNGGFLGKLAALCLAAGTLGGAFVFWLLLQGKRLLQGMVIGKGVSVASSGAWLSPRRTFWFSWLGIWLLWFPGYLAYYPAICSYDTPVQMAQIVEKAYNDHHPILHTLLLEGAWRLGGLLGHVNWGIGLFVLLQMLFLSGVFALGIAVLRAWKAGVVSLAALFLYCGLFPFHMYMSVTTTKDTIFSAFFLLMMLCLAGILRQKGIGRRLSKWEIGYLGAGIGMVLFRTNGRYALLVPAVILALALPVWKRRRKLAGRLLLLTMAVFVAGSLLLQGLFVMVGAQQGDRREMLSLPIQQLARTYVYHGGVGLYPEDDNTLEAKDREMIDDFILDQAYLEYRPDIADPVKRHTNTYVVRYRAKEFIGTYLGLLARYPGDYINAALAVNAGYLYPGDVSHAVINLNGRDRGLGYIQTRWVDAELNPLGIVRESKWEWLHEQLEKFADTNGYLQIPVLKYSMVPGVYLWFWLMLAAWLWVKKRYEELFPLAFILGYYITLFLGPTVQLRYIYPIMITLPYYLVLTRKGEKKD